MEGVVNCIQRYVDLTCSERCCGREGILLTDAELSAINDLRQSSREKFNEADEEHVQLLRELWGLLFTGVDAEPDLKSPKWKEVGFQGTYPGTDFRGAGVHGLKQLIYLATIYPAELREVLVAADYPFAISALNVTHYLMGSFQLNSAKTAQLPNQTPAPARILKNFSELQNRHRDAINELYCKAVFKMHLVWQQLKLRGTTIMEFSKAIDRSKEYVYAVLRKRPTSLDELKRVCLQLKLY
mmetsp:Transcript_32974/g.57934  ORF Transcript_32974/g.57934 Transcript_32974/m.57934 type:complete len:241 (+) Transcript_32974:1916-2638(+)